MATEPTPREEAQALLGAVWSEHTLVSGGVQHALLDVLTREVDKRRALEEYRTKVCIAISMTSVNPDDEVAQLEYTLATLREQLAVLTEVHEEELSTAHLADEVIAKLREQLARAEKHNGELMALAATDDIEVALGWVTAMQLAHAKLREQLAVTERERDEARGQKSALTVAALRKADEAINDKLAALAEGARLRAIIACCAKDCALCGTSGYEQDSPTTGAVVEALKAAHEAVPHLVTATNYARHCLGDAYLRDAAPTVQRLLLALNAPALRGLLGRE